MALVQKEADVSWRETTNPPLNSTGSKTKGSTIDSIHPTGPPHPQGIPIMHSSTTPGRLEDIMQSREYRGLLDLLDLIDFKHSRVAKNSRIRYLVLLRAIFQEYNILPSNFFFRMGDLKRLGQNAVGFGSFADVWKGTWLDIPVAVKVLRTGLYQEFKLEKLYLKELTIWKSLIHPHVLRLLGTAEGFPSKFAMVSPWMSNGDAWTYIQQHPEFDRVKLISEVASGLEYLHQQVPPISHGDLRGANILLDSYENAYLSDFGLAVVVKESMEGTNTNSIQQGNCRYLAPELLDPSLVGEELIGPSPCTDMHNFGMLMFEILTGLYPYHEFKYQGQVIAAVIVRQLRPKRPDTSTLEKSHITDEVWQVMERCWDFPPTRRPSISTVRLCIELRNEQARNVTIRSDLFDRSPISPLDERSTTDRSPGAARKKQKRSSPELPGAFPPMSRTAPLGWDVWQPASRSASPPVIKKRRNFKEMDAYIHIPEAHEDNKFIPPELDDIHGDSAPQSSTGKSAWRSVRQPKQMAPRSSTGKSAWRSVRQPKQVAPRSSTGKLAKQDAHPRRSARLLDRLGRSPLGAGQILEALQKCGFSPPIIPEVTPSQESFDVHNDFSSWGLEFTAPQMSSDGNEDENGWGWGWGDNVDGFSVTGIYPCEVCNIAFATATALRAHYRSQGGSCTQSSLKTILDEAGTYI